MKSLCINKKITFRYEVLDTFVAGISLLGHEVKSLRTQSTSLDGAYIVVKEQSGKFQIVLRGLYISPYQPHNQSPTYDPLRNRLLLLQKKEIVEIERMLHTKGVTLVPKSVGIEREKIKVIVALVRGKKKHDKRQDIKKRDQERDSMREHKTRFS